MLSAAISLLAGGEPGARLEGEAALLDALAAGAAMVLDDAADFGRTDRLHHWLVGLLVFAACLLVVAASWE